MVIMNLPQKKEMMELQILFKNKACEILKISSDEYYKNQQEIHLQFIKHIKFYEDNRKQ